MSFATLVRVAIAAIGLMACAIPARADAAYFRSPSDNIYCAYDDYEGTPFIRCDIMSFTPTIGNRPADCDLEWGDAFEISPAYRRGEALCHGDTVRNPDAYVLSYGKSFTRGGLACTSERSGMTCVNKKGHGFTLSRARQRVF